VPAYDRSYSPPAPVAEIVVAHSLTGAHDQHSVIESVDITAKG